MGSAAKPSPWLQVCQRFVRERGLDAGHIDPLRAFAATAEHVHPQLADPTLDFAELARRCRELAASLGRDIEDALRGELPPEGQRHYARRFVQLWAGLVELASPEAALLGVGLVARMAEILARPRRRRSRIRDLIDFYFCRGSVLLHRPLAQASVFAAARDLDWRPLGPGLEHAAITGHFLEGPARINLLRAREHTFEAHLPGEPIVDLGAFAQARDLAFASSGGYILGSQMDIQAPSEHGDPVALFVREGEVLNPPVFPRCALIAGPGGLAMRRVGLVGFEFELGPGVGGGRRRSIAGYNQSAGLGEEILAFSRTWGPRSPELPGRGLALAILGRRILAAGPGPLAIPKAGFVLTLPKAEVDVGREELGALVGRALSFFPPASLAMRSAVAAGPLLLDGGQPVIDLEAEDFVPAVPPYTFSADETLGQNLLPRMFAGLDSSGALILAAVDGRNFKRAIGMSLSQGAALMQALGCHRAINLDGGDSKRLAVEGRVVDLPGCELEWDPGEDTNIDAPIRPVHSALLWTQVG